MYEHIESKLLEYDISLVQKDGKGRLTREIDDYDRMV